MAIASGIASIGFGLYSTIDAANQQKKSAREIEEFQRQDLVNPFTNIPINTTREQFMSDAALSSQATSVDALQRGGTRSVLAGAPVLQEATNNVNNNIFASIDEKAARRDALIAQGEQRNQDIQENREQQALFGLGQQYQTARQDTMSGITNIVQGGLALGSAIDPDGGDPLKNLFTRNGQTGQTGNFNQATPDINAPQLTPQRLSGNVNQFDPTPSIFANSQNSFPRNESQQFNQFFQGINNPFYFR
jgi:hypothetical protein